MNEKSTRILIWRFCLAGVVSILSACTPAYVQPVDLNSVNGAKIVESKIHVLTPQLSSIIVNIVAVDNQGTGRFGSATTIVSPGTHQITFGAYYPDGIGPFGELGSFGLVANFQAGQTYYVQSTEPQKSWDNIVKAQAWIVDSAGNVVSTSTPIRLAGPQMTVP